jgi:hypothetical protein
VRYWGYLPPIGKYLRLIPAVVLDLDDGSALPATNLLSEKVRDFSVYEEGRRES